MKITQKISGITLILSLLFSLSGITFALENTDLDAIKLKVQEYQTNKVQNTNEHIEIMTERLQTVRDVLLNSYETFAETEKQISAYEQDLEPLAEKITSLKTQVLNIDLQLDRTQDKIRNIKILIAKRKTDIELAMQKLELSKIEMENQKRMVVHYVQLAYFEEQKYKTTDQDKNLLNLLLADSNFSETLKDEVYFNVMQDTSRQVFYKLNNAKNHFQKDKEKYDLIHKNLTNLKSLLDEEKNNLKLQLIAKEDLLTETEGKEYKYRKLLAESQKQQDEVVLEIENLQDNLEVIRDKLKLLKENESSAEVSTGSILAQSQINYIDIDEQESFFKWPVSPKKGISAYYHDASYKKFFKVVHNAIDIRQRQGSPIFAPANGYVYKIKDNGMGYSYIILAHRDGVMTVYGHVSGFLVNEGDLVHTGDIIGLTGGMPGTKGAGWMTTGPHLHFEVYQDGKHVNPLDYLPIEELPVEYIPAEYLKKIKLQ